MSAEIAALIGVVLTLVGLVVTLGLGLYQLSREFRNSLTLQEEHLRHELHLDIFREISDQLQRTDASLSKSSSKVGTILMQLDWQHRGLSLVTITAEDLAQTHFEAAQSLGALLMFLERYEIVFYRFRSARRIIGEEHIRFLDAYTELTRELGIFLPHQGGPTPHPFRPDTAKLEELNRLANSYQMINGSFSGYVLDLQIEAQNTLLGGLFQRKVPPRNPLDSSVKVLRADTEESWTERPPGRFV